MALIKHTILMNRLRDMYNSNMEINSIFFADNAKIYKPIRGYKNDGLSCNQRLCK